MKSLHVVGFGFKPVMGKPLKFLSMCCSKVQYIIDAEDARKPMKRRLPEFQSLNWVDRPLI
jgi:hypothetical protein